jgi:acetylornithine/succinyldiaminopimelate/putrescine aminotransferase
MLNQITDLAKKYKFINEVRGAGFMIGIDFGAPCRDIALKLLDKGLLVSCTAMNVIRLVPPLILTKQEVNEILVILKETFEELAENQ